MQNEYLAKLKRDHKRLREALRLIWSVLSPTDEAIAVEQLREHVQETLTNLEVKSVGSEGGKK